MPEKVKTTARTRTAGATRSEVDAEGGERRPAGVRSANNVRELYAWVRAAILNGKIGADEPISQSQLAAEFGVSRTPLREALRMLEREIEENTLHRVQRLVLASSEAVQAVAQSARVRCEGGRLIAVDVAPHLIE